MKHGLRFALVAAGFAGLAGMTPPAFGQAITIIGNSYASACSQDAIKITRTKELPGPAPFSDCSLALETEHLHTHDLAATYVNRGVLFLCESDVADARRDFDQAIHIKPELAESYVNRGAAAIADKRYQDAIADFDHGLTLNPLEPAIAYYDRAIAREELNDLKGAYQDYTQAAQLEPDWQMPKHELTRFKVRMAK